MDKWVVHKFGGSSVADAGCFRRVAAIVEASDNPREAVVLSACRGVTDALLALVSLAEQPGADTAAAIDRNLERLIPAGFTGRLIVTGFVATTTTGMQTTLGRNGSDFSGSIFGALLHAAQIIIWTDVDGVLSADPRLVPNAQVIDQLSYNEAMELAYFCAKVIHPQTMEPAATRGTPI